jgi:hypothetical protein
VLNAAEIARGIEGALKFVVRDPKAPSYFDNTFEACLRSFRVMVLAAPFFALSLMLYYPTVDTAADNGEIVAIEALHFVVDWLIFPVLFYEIARRQRWLDRYPRYIGALNWIGLPAMALDFVAFAVILQLPSPANQLVDLVRLVFESYWFLMATRLSLGIGWPLSFLLLFVNWVPSFFLSLIVDRILGVVPLPGG